MPTTAEWKDEMNVVAASIQRLIGAGRAAGLTNEAASLAAMIGLISSIRVDGLDEDTIIKEARKAAPMRKTH